MPRRSFYRACRLKRPLDAAGREQAAAPQYPMEKNGLGRLIPIAAQGTPSTS
jgi:hypothetical protein